MAEIHPQLREDCLILGRFTLSYLLLMNDSQYPWLILVPDRTAVTEIYHLTDQDQRQLWLESASLSAHIMTQFNGDKLNVAAMGNIVPQLHIHHIVRFQNDAAWPAPVWGKTKPTAYTDEELKQFCSQLDIGMLPEFETSQVC